MHWRRSFKSKQFPHMRSTDKARTCSRGNEGLRSEVQIQTVSTIVGADTSTQTSEQDLTHCTLMEGINHEEVLQIAVETAKNAGEYMLKGFHSVKQVEIKTAAHDLVTEYDRGTENIIVSALRKVYPTHRFIGEETTDQSSTIELSDEPTWIIDPIDGTINYVNGFHETAISMGFAVNKELLVGVIYNPIMNNLFTACKGKGAFQNGKRIQVSKCTEHRKSLVATEVSFACVPTFHQTVIERLRGLVSVAYGVRSLGSAATTLCYVANGSIDAYVQDELMCWDMAAGVLIIKEAGGIVMSSNGEPFNLMTKKILVAATQPLATELLDVVKKADERASQIKLSSESKQ